jgi:hypothetical protein
MPTVSINLFRRSFHASRSISKNSFFLMSTNDAKFYRVGGE